MYWAQTKKLACPSSCGCPSGDLFCISRSRSLLNATRPMTCFDASLPKKKKQDLDLIGRNDISVGVVSTLKVQLCQVEGENGKSVLANCWFVSKGGTSGVRSTMNSYQNMLESRSSLTLLHHARVLLERTILILFGLSAPLLFAHLTLIHTPLVIIYH